MSDNKIKAPKPNDPNSLLDQFENFVEIVKLLRLHCPWDREQTNESISQLLIEETYEMIDAINKGNDAEFSKELGDILLHVVMHAIMAEERGAFNMIDVLSRSSQKLIFRHSHVFGDVEAQNAGEVVKNWESMKMKEGGRKSILDGVPIAMPALLRAQRIQHKVANVGFDWTDKKDVWAKVEEEFNELKEELLVNNKKGAIEELGDFIFALVNAARFEDIVAEGALQFTNDKFMRRFKYIEEKAREMGKNLNDMTLGEMDKIWDEAKSKE